MTTKAKFFTRSEVALHNKKNDLWVMLLGKVLNLTSLCESAEEKPEIFPLLVFGGKDISHFFDEKGEVKRHINPNTNHVDSFLPFGPFIDVPPPKEIEEAFVEAQENSKKVSDNVISRFLLQRKGYKRFLPSQNQEELNFKKSDSLPWWKDETYVIGFVTAKSRWIKIRNTLIMETVDLEVCREETIEDILIRYLKFNKHARSYTWKYMGQELDMKETLKSNGIPDLELKCEELRLNEEEFVPVLNLYFKDDLTEF